MSLQEYLLDMSNPESKLRKSFEKTLAVVEAENEDRMNEAVDKVFKAYAEAQAAKTEVANIKKNLLKIAKYLLNLGVPVDKVVSYTNLDSDDIKS
ncbi:MAG: hypothetical protein LBF22_01555 [Deltaproteobacteria bacterium]|jgi:hypothetical protein|nr:hypothetical protein [Deltaproteobacteria bacterium]